LTARLGKIRYGQETSVFLLPLRSVAGAPLLRWRQGRLVGHGGSAGWVGGWAFQSGWRGLLWLDLRPDRPGKCR